MLTLQNMNETFCIERNAEVGDLTTFRIPARAAALVRWHDIADLLRALADDSLPRPLKVIGGGSNLLLTKPFEGTLLLRTGQPRVTVEGLVMQADAHAVLDSLCELTASLALRGMENLSGIPGTLGGALVQNAGAYGAETGALLIDAELLDTVGGGLLTVGRDWMRYAYRSSRLKAEAGRYVILSARLQLRLESAPANLDYGNLRELADPTPWRVRQAVLSTRRAKLPEPAEVGSAGSFFRNPEVPAGLLDADMPRYDLGNGLYKVPAAWLIDRAGLKGASVGGASVWPGQPLVIVNTDGHATADDVVALEHMIVSEVHRRFNITLNPEVEHL